MDSARDDVREEGYQRGGQSWDPARPDVLDLLELAEPVRTYPIYHGSNHTFLTTVDAADAGHSLAVYKPARGEYPLYDFPAGTLYRREVAAFLLDRLLGWCVVPPTVIAKGEYGIGSLQLFIESPDRAEVEVTDLRRMAILDVLINNADRKADHCLPGLDGRLWGIDHGLTFHVQPKLRTVLWHFAGTSLGGEERRDLERTLQALQALERVEACRLRELLSGAEWRALLTRLERILTIGALPNPRYKPVPYRW